MKKNLIIISAGQFGREIYNWASQAIAEGEPWKIKGFLDDRPNVLNDYNYDVDVIGNVAKYSIGENDVFIGAIGNPMEKVKYYTPIIERGGEFINLIHPLANIGNNVQLGNGIVLAPYTSITCDAQVGNNVTFGSYSNAGHDTKIGDWCQISSHCGINGGVVLEDKIFLGSHSCIVPQLHIASSSYIGAGSVVLRNVAERTKVFGNPAIKVGNVE